MTDQLDPQDPQGGTGYPKKRSPLLARFSAAAATNAEVNGPEEPLVTLRGRTPAKKKAPPLERSSAADATTAQINGPKEPLVTLGRKRPPGVKKNRKKVQR